MKSDARMTAEILEEVRVRRKAQKKRNAVFGAALGVFAVTFAVLGLWRGSALQNENGTTALPETADASDTAHTTLPATQNATAPTDIPDGGERTPTDWQPPETTDVIENTDPISVQTTGGVTSGAYEQQTTNALMTTTQNLTTDRYLSGGSNALYVLPEKPASEQLNVTGEKLTDAKAQAYFKENLPWLQSALSASGVAADDLHVSKTGYSHVAFENSGVQGYAMTTDQGCVVVEAPVCMLRQNFRDYPVYNGNELVAIITLVLENGELYATPAFGGAWFKPLGEFFAAHKGEELLFLYFGGQQEFILTPNGEVRNPQGQELVPDFGGITDPYRFFYAKQAVYVP